MSQDEWRSLPNTQYPVFNNKYSIPTTSLVSWNMHSHSGLQVLYHLQVLAAAADEIISMWKCAKCGERHADHFSSCWKCAGMEAPPRSFTATPSVSMSCPRCNAALDLMGAWLLQDESGARLG